MTSAAAKLDARKHVHAASPLGRLETLCDGCDGALGGGRVSSQPCGGIGAIRFVLSLDPFRVGIARRRFAREPEPAFRRALEKCFEERRRDGHAEILLLSVGYGELLRLPVRIAEEI